MQFPILYKKNVTGKIEQWEIYVAQKLDGRCHINVTFGDVGGKMQTTSDTVKEGKNIGKANETTVFEQACKDAKSKWEKKKKKGYVESIEAAQAGEVDDLIEGGIEPMLAHVYEKHGDKITFPCYAQPKLDGIRCIAIKKGNEVTLWSRTRKRITSCPHIEDAIKLDFAHVANIILDGELYNHELMTDPKRFSETRITEGTVVIDGGFEQIVSAVRKEKPSPESQLIEYHIYDMVDTQFTTKERLDYLDSNVVRPPLKVLWTLIVNNQEDVAELFKRHTKAGYEGVMLRNMSAKYENKRSYNLQKVKEFQDSEFEIVGVVEGKGKLQGLLGAFLCKTQDGTEFEVKMTGNQEETRKFLNNPTLCVGKMLTVQYQGITGKNKVPRFPVGLRIREEGL